MATIDASEEVRASAPSNPPRENLYRAAYGDGAIELRDTTDGMPTLTGHFAVFDTFTEINSAYEGRFMERFAPGSLTKTLNEGRSAMRVLFQHGKDPSIGDKVLGPIERLEADDTGAYYEVPLLDTSYNRDLVPGLRAGLYGASHRFQVVKEDFNKRAKPSEHNPLGLPERTVTEARVREFGPVTFGAYPTATAGVRSLTDEFLFDELVADKERLRGLCKRAGISLAGTGYGGTGAVTINVAPFVSREEPEEIPADEQDDEDTNEPDVPTEDATPDETKSEPELPEATTRSSHDLFRFVEPPAHMRSK